MLYLARLLSLEASSLWPNFAESPFRNCLESLRHGPTASPLSAVSSRRRRTPPRWRTAFRNPCSCAGFGPTEGRYAPPPASWATPETIAAAASAGRSSPSLAHSSAPRPASYPCPRIRHRARGLSSARARCTRSEAATLARPARGPWRSVYLGFEYEALLAYERAALLRPLTFLPPSYPLRSAPTRVAFADRESPRCQRWAAAGSYPNEPARPRAGRRSAAPT